MNATYTITTTSERRSVRQFAILTALIVALVAGVVLAYSLTRSQPTEALAPVTPFVDGFAPAQPM